MTQKSIPGFPEDSESIARLRFRVALRAMQALITHHGNRQYEHGWERQYANVAQHSVLFADALLEALTPDIDP